MADHPAWMQSPLDDTLSDISGVRVADPSRSVSRYSSVLSGLWTALEERETGEA